MKVYNERSEKPICDELLDVIKDIREKRAFDVKLYVEEKSDLLNRYMSKFNLKSCVVAVSGGVDSAAVLAIVNHASKKEGSPIKKIVPLLLPIVKSSGVTNQEDATMRGVELCEKLGLESCIVDLSLINTTIRNALEPVVGITGDDWAVGQLGPYSRTPMLYYTTSLLCKEGLSAIICGTTNKDEGTYLGYIGKASDGMVDVQIISDIHKSEVYEVAKYLGVPDSIIKVVPSGDMYDNRSDETVFGAPYDFVQLYLTYLNYTDLEKQELLDKLSDEAKEQFQLYANNLENLHRYNLHKYMSSSPAIHLDLFDSSVKGGWEGYYDKIKKIMGEEGEYANIKDCKYTDEEEQVLFGLKNIIIENGIPKQYFSFDGYAEEAICLEKKDIDEYEVFIGERGQKYEVSKFNNLSDAGINILSHLSDTASLEEKMCCEFWAFMDKMKNCETGPVKKIGSKK